MNTIRCIVKGNRFQAAIAAAERKIPFVFDYEARNNETTGLVGSQHLDRVIEWYCEPSSNPNPTGTLLFYSSRPTPAEISTNNPETVQRHYGER